MKIGDLVSWKQYEPGYFAEISMVGLLLESPVGVSLEDNRVNIAKVLFNSQIVTLFSVRLDILQ